MIDTPEKLLPKHVAIVMDGNGRWAKQKGLPRNFGHKAGVNRAREIIRYSAEQGIKVLSLFAFGQENWARPEEEVSHLMSIFLLALQRDVKELHENNVCLRFIGHRERLDIKIRNGIEKAEALTQNNKGLVLVIAINYSGQWDITQACQSLMQKLLAQEISIEDIEPQFLAKALSLAPLPDPCLFIRTSGEQRISNFFLWQLSYSELYFTQTLWPDFDVIEYEKALLDYSKRCRRFGKTPEQMEQNRA